jgi:hypothetical protein
MRIYTKSRCAPGGAKVRGLKDSQWTCLKDFLHCRRRLVCATHEDIPFLDYLDLVYTPEAKSHYLASHHYYGANFVLAENARINNGLNAFVVPHADLDKQALTLRLGGDGSNNYYKPHLPVIGDDLSSDLCFMPLEDLAKTNLSPDVKRLHEIYGRHVVRCAREAEVFLMAMVRLQALFENASCVRVIAHMFPEIIQHIPDDREQYDYFRKTKENKWASKFKINPGEERRLSELLGDNWPAYKRVIMSIITRAMLVESINKDRLDPKPAVDRWGERGWYDHGGRPMSEWKIRVSFMG